LKEAGQNVIITCDKQPELAIMHPSHCRLCSYSNLWLQNRKENDQAWRNVVHTCGQPSPSGLSSGSPTWTIKFKLEKTYSFWTLLKTMTKHKSTNLNHFNSHWFKIAKGAIFSHMQDVGLSSKGGSITYLD
jgi:hypothetical protein